MSNPLILLTKRRKPLNLNPRNIAGGVRASTALSNGTHTGQNMRSSHINESGIALTELAIVYSGWSITTTNEAANANAFTVTAAIEYPAGVFTQVTWASASSKAIAPGANEISDYVTGFSIPAGAQFWVRTFVNVASGEVWPLSSIYGVGTVSANGEACERGTGITDKTMGGTITGTSTGLRPSAIIAKWSPGMRKVSLAGFGDSTIHGAYDETFDAGSNTSWCGRASTGNCPYLMMSFGGQTLAASNDALALRLDLLVKAGITHIIVSMGANDVADNDYSAPGAADTAVATMQARLQTLWNALKTTGAEFLHAGMGPRSDSTDDWYTVANQTPKANWNGPTAVAHRVNDYMSSVPWPLSGFFDKCGILSTSRYSGIFITGDSNPQTRLQTSTSLTASGTPTTSNVPFTPTLATGYQSNFLLGRVEFTSGVLAGTFKSDSGVNNSTSALTLTGAAVLASAPAAGDTFIARPFRIRSTSDGIHAEQYTASGTIPAITGNQYGGHMIMMDRFIPMIWSWNA